MPGIRSILLLLVLGLLLPGVVGTGALIELMYRRNAEAMNAGTAQTSRALLQAVENRLDQALLLAQVLAAGDALSRDDLAAFHRTASTAVKLPNIANNVVLVDRSGQQQVNTSVPFGTPLPRVADSNAVRRVFDQGRPVVGDLVVGNVVRRPLVGIYVPVVRNGRADRAVIVVVLAPMFDTLLAAVRGTSSPVAVILDGAGTVVARSQEPERYVGGQSTAPLRAAIARQAQGSLVTTLLDGREVVATFSRSERTGWSVVIGVPLSEFQATLGRSILLLSAGAAALLLLSLLLGQLAGGRILQAYDLLVQAAAALGAGRPVPHARQRVREARRVHEAIRHASELLADRETRLREKVDQASRLNEELALHRSKLESLVAERTAALAERTRQLEAALLDAQAASRAKSAFLANMSHEIRTPMNAIMGLTYLLGREPANERQRDRLGKVHKAAEHLLGILNDILDLSKIEAGRMQLQHRRFSLHALVADVAAIADTLAQAKALTLHVEADPGILPDRLEGDETRLRQALLNYVGNAIKFTDRGRVEIRVSLLERQGSRVLLRFAVSDTGIGIEPGKLPGLFNAFEQADMGHDRKTGGTGLGLAITREFAKLMGGSAGADSTPEVGSTFWFTAWLEVQTPEGPLPQ